MRLYTRLTTRLRWALGALAFAGMLSSTLTACAPAPAQSPPAFVAVIDAGSSGSRIHLFTENDHVVTEIALTNDEIDVPLASFAQDPAAAGEAVIKPLVEPVETFATANDVALQDITVNVLGTAGMRKVSQSESGGIYADVADALETAGFTVGLTETITGNQEALYAWTDANDLNQSLGNSSVEPIGIVEVGGASAQVAFALTEPDVNAGSNMSDITVNDVEYSVFTYSYLGLGQNDARKSMLDDPQAGVRCYPNSGDSAQTLALTDSLSVPAGQADYDFTTCTNRYQEVIATTAEPFPLSQMAALAGFNTTKFYGLSSIAFAASDFEADPNDAQASLEAEVTAECTGASAANRVSARFAPDEQTFAMHACANATYISTLLQTLAISSSNFIAAPDIQGDSPSWPRGFAVLSAWGQVS